MKKTRTLSLASAGVLALAVFAGAPAYAVGTISGTTITNNVTVNYQVGGVAQTAVNASNAFVVDRRVNLTVAEVGTVTTQVSPGQTAAVTTFTVTNTSNAPLDFALTATQLAGGTAAHGGTDNFDVTGLSIFRDTNGNGSYDAGTDTAVTFLDEVAADGVVTVFLVGNVPLGRATGDVAGVQLRATGREAGAAGSQGAALTETAGANTAGVDTVFGDTAGVNDANRDASHSDDDDYTVLAANVSVTKTSRVISDPFNGTTNPKLIPGAVVEYCIQVANAAGGASATSVAISDPVPAQTTYVASSVAINGTVTAGNCNADGGAGGSFAAGVVSGTIATVAAGDTRTLVFRVTVN